MEKIKKANKYPVIVLVTLIFVILTNCKEIKTPKPNIVRIDPASAGPGEYITIIGENFQFASTLVIGEKSINANSALEDTFISTIPEIDPGNVKIYFEYVDGESNNYNYTILTPRPYISYIIPDTVDVLDTLKIFGGNFDANSIVYIENNSLEEVNVNSDSSILAVIPLDVNSGNLYISSNDRESFSKYVWISNSKIPNIQSIEPDSFLVGDTILIEGENFINDSLTILFDEIVADDYWLLSNHQLKVIVPEILISGIITLKTIFGEDKKTYKLIDKQTLIPIVTEQLFNVYLGETIIIEGKNLGENYNLHLEYNGIPIPNNFFSIEAANEIRLFTSSLQESGELLLKNDYGSVTINIQLKQPPTISEHRPSQNPKDWPLLIIGENFEDVQEIIFDNDNEKFVISINDPRIQHNYNQKTIGVKIPELFPDDYDVYLKIKDEVFSNKINFKIIDYTPQGLPGLGSTSLVIPNNPPAASLSSFNNIWSFVNVDNTINFYDESNSNDEFGEGLESFGNLIEATGRYKKDGTLIELEFKEGTSIHKYVGSLDDKYWDSPESKTGVYRVILTPVKEGTQIELIFPLGLDSIAPSDINPQEEFIIYGSQFHVSDFYEVIFTNQNDQTSSFNTDSSSIEITRQTEMIIRPKSLGLQNGEYKIQIDFNGSISNSISYEIK